MRNRRRDESGAAQWETDVIKRKLGNSALEVGPLALGGNVFGWTADEPMSFKLLDAFVASGLNLIDTADVYSKWIPGHKGGESETIIGNWLKQQGGRDKVVIATKLGVEMGPGDKGLSKAYMLRAVERSLRAAENGLHRPLSITHGRRGNAARRDPRNIRRPDQGGKSPGDWRIELQGRTAC